MVKSTPKEASPFCSNSGMNGLWKPLKSLRLVISNVYSRYCSNIPLLLLSLFIFILPKLYIFIELGSFIVFFNWCTVAVWGGTTLFQFLELFFYIILSDIDARTFYHERYICQYYPFKICNSGWIEDHWCFDQIWHMENGSLTIHTFSIDWWLPCKSSLGRYELVYW